MTRPEFFFIFCFTEFFRNKLGSEDEIKIKIKIHSGHFPIELKSKKTQNCVSFDFNTVIKLILPIKMAISHQVLSLGVIESTWLQ